MIATLLIAMAAGCAAALMFASIISGALISLLLFYLAPLPLMMAALGWGPLSAAVGGIAAAVGLGAIFGLTYSVAFVVMVALPAWWLGHLALLGRRLADADAGATGAAAVDGSVSRTTPPAAPSLEWYPIGRILLWITGFAVLTTMATLLTLGTDAATITGTMQQGLLRVINSTGTVSSETEQWVDALVKIAPAAAAIIAMTTLALNLWLAAKITAASGRLHRPWPDLKTAALPPLVLAAFSVAIAICFTGGLLAILAQTAAAALTMAYAIVGFAVLHTMTLALRNRALWLSSAYAFVIVFSWPVLVMAALGLADAVFGLRRRYWQNRPPPPAPA